MAVTCREHVERLSLPNFEVASRYEELRNSESIHLVLHSTNTSLLLLHRARNDSGSRSQIELTRDTCGVLPHPSLTLDVVAASFRLTLTLFDTYYCSSP
jgi:hypothetical protein